jgi:putative tryptophan/tyrosine transport system substrate-binding protein
MAIDFGRRQFISVLGSTAVAWPLAARAQNGERVRRLGLLLALREDDPVAQQFVTAFVRALRELGWTDGVNIRIDYRWAGDDVGRIHSAASELLDLKPDAILTQSALTLAPLRQMTTTIPIVFLQIADPVSSGFVASLARPGGNITGFALAEFVTSGKMVEMLKEVAPQVTRVAVIYNPVQVPQMGMWHAIEAAAPSLSVQVRAVSADNADGLTRSIGDFASEPGSGMIVLPNPITRPG